MKILLVEDSTFYQKLFQNFFDKQNIDYEICEHGCYAIESIQSNNFDYIFLDLVLPDISGPVIYAEYLEHSNATVIPITGYNQNLQEFLSQFDQFIIKPFTEDVLKKVLGLEEFQSSYFKSISKNSTNNTKKDLLSFCNSMGVELSLQLLDNFSNTLKNEITTLHRLFNQNHLHEIENMVHQVKANARYFGFRHFADVCEEVERNVISGTIENVPNSIDTLIDMSDNLNDAICWAKCEMIIQSAKRPLS